MKYLNKFNEVKLSDSQKQLRVEQMNNHIDKLIAYLKEIQTTDIDFDKMKHELFKLKVVQRDYIGVPIEILREFIKRFEK